MQTLIVIILLIILGSLASGMYYMVKDGNTNSRRTLKALTWRVGLSVGLFALLMLGYATGLLRPHGMLPEQPSGQQQQETSK